MTKPKRLMKLALPEDAVAVYCRETCSESVGTDGSTVDCECCTCPLYHWNPAAKSTANPSWIVAEVRRRAREARRSRRG